MEVVPPLVTPAVGWTHSALERITLHSEEVYAECEDTLSGVLALVIAFQRRFQVDVNSV